MGRRALRSRGFRAPNDRDRARTPNVADDAPVPAPRGLDVLLALVRAVPRTWVLPRQRGLHVQRWRRAAVGLLDAVHHARTEVGRPDARESAVRRRSTVAGRRAAVRERP